MTKRVHAPPPGSLPPGGFGQAVQLLQRVSRRLPDLEAAAAQLCRPVGGGHAPTAPDGDGAELDTAAGPPGQVGQHRERLTALLDRFAAGGAGVSGSSDRPRHEPASNDNASSSDACKSTAATQDHR